MTHQYPHLIGKRGNHHAFTQLEAGIVSPQAKLRRQIRLL